MSTGSTTDLSDLDFALFDEVRLLDAAADDSEATTSTHPLYLAKPTRGRDIIVKDVWAQAREPHLHEPKRNEYGQKIWYCKRCARWKSTISNGRTHLRTHYSIDLRKPLLL